MDDLTLRYYDAEMRYLLEAGEAFARAHPEQAAMLNLDTVSYTHLDVYKRQSALRTR